MIADVQVVIADDNYLLREGLQRLIELDPDMRVLAACQDMADLLQTVDRLEPDVVVTDIRMPPDHTDEGVRAALAIRHKHPHIGVVVLSQYASPTYAITLLGDSTDGIGYLLKDRITDAAQLKAALTAVTSGGSVVDSDVVQALIGARSGSGRSPLSELTDRELEVLAAMAEGRSNGGIAAQIHAADRTVEKYISSIFSKLGLAHQTNVNRRVLAVLTYLAETDPDRSGAAPAS